MDPSFEGGVAQNSKMVGAQRDITQSLLILTPARVTCWLCNEEKFWMQSNVELKFLIQKQESQSIRTQNITLPSVRKLPPGLLGMGARRASILPQLT